MTASQQSAHHKVLSGGDEASLFASELFKMYQKYAGFMHWKWEEMSLTKTDIGGFKEAQAVISGEQVFKHLKFESGVHRVQRIPCNDTKIQTSAASVIVLPEAEELDVEVRPQDLRIDVFRAGGAGGQSVNKTESAVRMVHIPTGLVVSMQVRCLNDIARNSFYFAPPHSGRTIPDSEQSQSFEILKSQVSGCRTRSVSSDKCSAVCRLYDLERRKSMAARSELRSAAQGTGDRSDKIRTYNYPQVISRVFWLSSRVIANETGSHFGPPDIADSIGSRPRHERRVTGKYCGGVDGF